MQEIIIVVADLFVPRAAALAPVFGGSAGCREIARFGSRAFLPHGWRGWLAARLGRAELAQVAVAAVAACALGDEDHATPGTAWIATPLQLTAGLTRVHLDHRGLLRLLPAEQAVLTADFARTFGSADCRLRPLRSGDFLLRTPGIAPLAALEPARCAGGEVGDALPQGSAAAPLRRLLAEIEMWLHGLPLNAARLKRAAAPVTTLWPWGAEGRMMPPAVAPAPGALSAYGRDAWLEGCVQLCGATLQPLPAQFAPGSAAAPLCVWVLDVGDVLQQAGEGTVAQALAQLDGAFVLPALAALRRGECRRLTLLLNDVALSVTRASRWRVWRRAGRALERLR